MKYQFVKVFTILIVLGLIYVGWFAYGNLRGAGPAFGPKSGDIAKLFVTPAATPNQQVKNPVNNTKFPLQIPAGFTMSIYANDAPGARALVFDPNGTLLVSLTLNGAVEAVPNPGHTGQTLPPVTVVSGLNNPHGLAFKGNTLYIAESNQVATYDYDPATFKATNKKKIIDLPNDGFHYTRTIRFGPDGRLYVSIGSDCNVCRESDSRRASIYVANPDGSDFKPYATGLRNAVFFTWSGDGRMWATVMGRDYLGDDLPPDTIDIIREGKNYGWPYCYGKNVWDSSFDRSQKAKDFCTTVEPSYIDYQAHSAPLGLAFVPKSWPATYTNSLLVAMHGSWNRSVPTGYKIVRFKFDDKGNYLGGEDFITGWLQGSGALGRPVDLLFDLQGNLFVSDDKAGVIYILKAERGN